MYPLEPSRRRPPAKRRRADGSPSRGEDVEEPSRTADLHSTRTSALAYAGLAPRDPPASDVVAVDITIETRRSGILGAGAYGAVRRARVSDVGAAGAGGASISVAVKSFLGSTAGCWPQSAIREIVSLASVGAHPGVIRLHCAYMDARGKPHLAMPLLQTSLSEHVRCTLRGSVPAAKVMAWTAQILQSLAHVHAAGFLHRDVKLENILLDASSNAVLADFGMARHRVVGSEPRPLTGNVCSLWTRCPELCVARPSYVYDDRVDAWSMGCVMLALAAGRYVIRSASAEHSTLPCVFQLLGLPSTRWPFQSSVGFSTAAYDVLTRQRQLANVIAACGDRTDLPPVFYTTALELLCIDSSERVTVQAVASRPEWKAVWTTLDEPHVCDSLAQGGGFRWPVAAIQPHRDTSDSLHTSAPCGGGETTPSATMRRHAALWAWDVSVGTLKLHPLTALYGLAAWMRAVPCVVLGTGNDLVLLAACCSLAAKLNDVATVLPSSWTKACGSNVRVRQLHDAEHVVMRVLHGALTTGVSARTAAEGVAALALLAVTDWSLDAALAHARDPEACPDEWRLACLHVGRIAQAAVTLRTS